MQHRNRTFGWLICFFVLAAAAAAQTAPFPLIPGEAVATCFSDSNPDGFVFGILDLRDPTNNAPGTNTNWDAPMFHNENGMAWTADNFAKVSQAGAREVFGIALDDESPPNIYLTATSSYVNNSRSGLGLGNKTGSGEVFKIDGVTGNIDLFATVENFGQGLGNIAYDPVHEQFFVSNFYDGKIYRIARDGTVVPGGAFDPLAAFDPTASPPTAFVPRVERPWGLAVHEGRLYFGMWEGDPVRSVAIDSGTGALVGPDPVEVDTSLAGARPVSDIAFSRDGRMLIAERQMSTDTSPVAHSAQVLEFVLDVGGWGVSNRTFEVGLLPQQPPNPGTRTNATGGVDYLCLSTEDEYVLATGDVLIFQGGNFVYGVQMTPASGGRVENSFLIDIDGDIQQVDKFDIGDVEAFDACSIPCFEIAEATPICEADGSFSLSLDFENLRPETIHHAFVFGPEGVTIEPSYIDLSGDPVSTNTIGELPELTIRGASPGETLTFTLTIHNENLEECCGLEVTVELPQCDCAQVVSDFDACKVTSGSWGSSGFTYDLVLENLSDVDVSHLLLAPSRPKGFNITPSHFPVSLEDGQSTDVLPITVEGSGSASEEVCFFVGLLDDMLSKCCSFEHCVEPKPCFADPAATLPKFTPVGSARLSFFQEALHVNDLRPGFLDGVETPIQGPSCWLKWDIHEFLGAEEVLFTFEVTDDEGEEVGGVTVTQGDRESVVSGDFRPVGATSVRAEIHYRGEVVATVESANGEELLRYDRWPEAGGVTRQGGAPLLVLDHPGVQLHLVDGRAVVGDRTLISPLGVTDAVQDLGRLRLRADGVPRLIIEDFGPAFDCDENGVDDAQDIASGVAPDVNGNGVPDGCEPDIADLVSILNTGFDESTGTLLPKRAPDSDWAVLGLDGPRHARVVANPVTNWPRPLPGSAWISVEPERGTSVPGSPVLRFERCFCLSEEVREVSLSAFVFADDDARVLLNGTHIAGPGGSFAEPDPLTVHQAGRVGDGLFVPGRNCVVVEVDDRGGNVTGFDLAGEVRGNDATCVD